MQARARLENAHVLVVNHHLLFADLALRLQLDDWHSRAVLPAFDRLVLDEGHTVDAIATGFFGLQLTRLGVLRTLGSLAPQKKAPGGLLYAVQNKLDALRGSQTLGAHRPSALFEEVGQTRQTFERAFAALGDLISNDAEKRDGRLDLPSMSHVCVYKSWCMVDPSGSVCVNPCNKQLRSVIDSQACWTSNESDSRS